MSDWIEVENEVAPSVSVERSEFDLYMRGEIPACLAGSLIVATSRRHKNRALFSRWHDSQADLLKLDVYPGRPGRVRARFLAVDPNWSLPAAYRGSPFYATQPNHGINCSSNRIWATNLLFGAPLEIDVEAWEPRRVLRFLTPTADCPQISSTAHFAWSIDGRYAYFHQSLLEKETADHPVRSAALTLIELDVVSGAERTWSILPPEEDAALEGANFHSAFYFEEDGVQFVGLLRTGAVIESLGSHGPVGEHAVTPMEPSTIWIIAIDRHRSELRASLLPGIRELGGFALSHLDVDGSSRDGFVLFANCKQADVAEETHGENLYGESPEAVPEHYSGMIIEPFNFGQVIRYSHRGGRNELATFSRPYEFEKTSMGHSWLPINIELDSLKQRVFCSFSGFRPRLLPRHVAEAYPNLVADVGGIRYVPPLLMRFDASTMQPDIDAKRRHLSYAEPVAMAVVGNRGRDYICTFSPEFGLRIYDADDLTTMVGYGVSAELMTYRDTHYRPMPAHMIFAPH